ncbi:MAG TPA: SDR family NAD(P)-dependent oxidoreductase, partial [Holophagaceae bacterium]|nr:SDR family NAD(P)-dependent oxidoreductase [Holophagaceae bacterium]
VFAGAVDTRETEPVRAFVDAAAAALGGLHVVVANAGLARGLDKVWEIPDADLEAMLRTNVEGVVKTIRFALPHLRRSGWGHVFFIGSTAGHQSYEGGGVYCASKHGVKALAHTLRLELCGEPIRVTSVDPGMVDTAFSLVRFEDAARARGVYAGMTPLAAADVAECVRWALELPEHVNIDELIVKPRDQASHTGAKVARNLTA